MTAIFAQFIYFLLAATLLTHALPSQRPLPPSSDPALTIVNTTSGPIAGFPSSPYTSITSYLGIPYAAPPVGPLRFAPPRPFVPNHFSQNTSTPAPQHINALTPPKACMQLTFTTLLNDKLAPVAAESEDCLTLNIWTPALPDSRATELLPVLIWLHGGGFAQGSSSPTDGVALLRDVPEGQEYVVVSVNYRLNVFGFPYLREGKRNVGLRDQRAAVEWVRENVREFGGDKERMVLMGQSAGAQSVAHWGFAYEEEPIVRALVMWSGQPEGGLRDEGVGWERAVGRLDCAGEGGEAGLLECMREKGAREVKSAVSVSNFLRYDDYVDGWSAGSPSADNETNFDAWGGQYVERGLQGMFAKIPVWISYAVHDGDNLVSFDDRQPDAYKNGTGAINQTEADLTTLMAMHCPAWLHTGFRVANNVTVYRSAYNGTFASLRPYHWMRAYHAEDIGLAFRADESVAWDDADVDTRQAGQYLREAIAAFVHDPESGLAELGWMSYVSESQALQVLFSDDTATAATVNASEHDAPCHEIWREALASR